MTWVQWCQCQFLTRPITFLKNFHLRTNYRLQGISRLAMIGSFVNSSITYSNMEHTIKAHWFQHMMDSYYLPALLQELSNLSVRWKMYENYTTWYGVKPQILQGNPRPSVLPCIMASSAMELQLTVLVPLQTTHTPQHMCSHMECTYETLSTPNSTSLVGREYCSMLCILPQT